MPKSRQIAARHEMRSDSIFNPLIMGIDSTVSCAPGFRCSASLAVLFADVCWAWATFVCYQRLPLGRVTGRVFLSREFTCRVTALIRSLCSLGVDSSPLGAQLH